MLAFYIIGGVGLVLLLISFLIGEFLDGAMSVVDSDLFSGVAIAGFLASLGFIGAVTLHATGNTLLAVLAGVSVGLVIGAGAGWASKALIAAEDDATVRTGDLVGHAATVVGGIPEQGYGQISLVANGHITRLNARGTTALPAGIAVTVIEVLSPTSVLVRAATPQDAVRGPGGPDPN